MRVHTILVFPDGETWNTIDGCIIKTVTSETFTALCEDRMDAGDCPEISSIVLSDFTPGPRDGNAK